MSCFSAWSLREEQRASLKTVRWASAPSVLESVSIDIDDQEGEPTLNGDPAPQTNEMPDQPPRNRYFRCSCDYHNVEAFVAFIIFCIGFGCLIWKFVTRP